MKQQNKWVLPEGIEEVLPPQAEQLEQLCRNVIDLFTRWGYQLVIPPLVEYLDSLLTGTGKDLDLQTFKITDQITGRLMGIRADTTPQVARIDAHKLKREVPTRLCYLGTVIHTRPDTTGGSRSPLQVGAELYGHDGVESDVEVLCLMIETLRTIGIGNFHIDIGHVGIYRGLITQAGLSSELETELFDILQRKAMPELEEFLDSVSLPSDIADMFRFLISANGNVDILQDAQQQLASANSDVKKCLEYLQHMTALVVQRIPECSLYFDLAELRGYHYHNGVMFTAYSPGSGQGIAYGGRYDAIGSAFGRARPATGFSTDLKNLLQLSGNEYSLRSGIFAPQTDDPELLKVIDELRRQGEIVICELPGQTGDAQAMGCDRILKSGKDGWSVVKL